MTYPPQPPYGQPPAGDPNQPPYGGQQPYGQPVDPYQQQPYGQPAYGQQPPAADPYQSYGQGYGQPPVDPYQPGGYADRTAIYQQQPAPFGGGYGAPQPPPKSKNGLIFGIAGGVVVIGIIVALLIVLTGGSKTKQDASSGGQKVASTSTANAPRSNAPAARTARAGSGSAAAEPSAGAGGAEPSGGSSNSGSASNCAAPTKSGESAGIEEKSPIMEGLLSIFEPAPDVEGTETGSGVKSYWVCWGKMDQLSVTAAIGFLQDEGYGPDPNQPAATSTKASFVQSDPTVKPTHLWVISDGSLIVPSDPNSDAAFGDGTGYFEIDWQDS